jgi:hypothetical protein
MVRFYGENDELTGENITLLCKKGLAFDGC